MIVSKTIEFDAGHRVARHGSQCANPHGHRYAVTLSVSGPVKNDQSSEHGMVVDFARLNAFLYAMVHDKFDHGFIVERSDDMMRIALQANPQWKVILIDPTPTAENLAEMIGHQAIECLGDEMNIIMVKVKETPTSVATWTP